MIIVVFDNDVTSSHVNCGPGYKTEAEIDAAVVGEAEYIGMWHTLPRIGDKHLALFKKCKVNLSSMLLARITPPQLIVRMGVGYDNIDHEAAGRRGIAVVNIPAYGTEEVADTAFALILGMYRQTDAMATHVRRGQAGCVPDACTAAHFMAAGGVRQ